jgi:ribose transport system substrate-binding protein
MTSARWGCIRAAASAALLCTLTVTSCDSPSDEGSRTRDVRIVSSKALGATRGPSGERAVSTSALRLSAGDVEKIRAGNYTAALLWHETSDFTTALTAGARDELQELGIEVVAETTASFDPAKQKADIETVGAKSPSVMLTLPVDPVVTASSYRDVAAQGTKIVLLSSVPRGMQHGRDYVTMVTDDLYQMGKRAADALAAAVGSRGTVAYFFHDAKHFVTNERDRAFLETLRRNYPEIKIVEEGVADPNRAEAVADAALVQKPDLDGAYVTFAQPPGDGVLASLRAAHNRSARLVTLDLDEPLALDMARRGSTFALIVDKPYELGQAMAKAAAYGLLGRPAPAFVVGPAMTITRSNLVEGYRASLRHDPPQSVLRALDE